MISWNEREDLARCLTALETHPAQGGQQVVVVDNGSGDGTVEMLRAREGVELIANPRNRGAAAARNQGLRRCRGRYVCILDSDAYVHAGALESLCRLLDDDPAIGLVGPRLVFEDGTLQMSCRRVPSPLAVLANRLTRVGRLRDHPSRRRHLMLDEPHDAPMDVEYMLGATMMFRRAPVTRIGGFDERLTTMGFGFEDADWALRFRHAGWRVVYSPAATVTHGYRRRLAARPLSHQNLGMVLSYALLRFKHRSGGRRG